MSEYLDPVYLDHAAATPIHPEVLEAMLDCHRRFSGNPASLHGLARRARRELEDAREQIAAILGADLTGPHPDRLVFTSGGTEANNLAVCGLCGPPGSTLAVSAIEHPSVLEPARALADRGWQLEILDCLPSGVIDLEGFAGPVSFLSLMLGNNETGVLQPVGEAVGQAAKWNAVVHCDAVQVAGKRPISFRNLGVDALTWAAHKLQGPTGIGGLLLAPRAVLQPLVRGGFQQGGLRAGTESVPLAVGALRAFQLWQQDWQNRSGRLAQLRDQLERGLLAADPAAVVNGQAERLPHILNISFPGLDRQALFVALDLAGIACATGSACASGASGPSHVLEAMTDSPAIVQGAIRFSVGATTTDADIEQAVAQATRVLRRLRAAPAGKTG